MYIPQSQAPSIKENVSQCLSQVKVFQIKNVFWKQLLLKSWYYAFQNGIEGMECVFIAIKSPSLKIIEVKQGKF